MAGTTGPTVTLISLSPSVTGANVGGGRGANAGHTIGLQGDILALGTGQKLNQLQPMPFEAFASATADSSGVGPVGTMQWETAPEPALTGGTLAYTIWGSAMVWSATAAPPPSFVGKMPTTAAYIRARLTAWTSGYFTAYLRPV